MDVADSEDCHFNWTPTGPLDQWSSIGTDTCGSACMAVSTNKRVFLTRMHSLSSSVSQSSRYKKLVSELPTYGRTLSRKAIPQFHWCSFSFLFANKRMLFGVRTK
jgi:hypothetical protein